MIVGFVLDDTFDSSDGVQQYIKLLGRWLEQNGHEVHFLVGQSSSNQKNVHSLAKNIKVSFNKNKMSIPIWSSKKDILSVLNKVNFDVLHIQMPYSPILAARIINSANKNSRIIGTFHVAPHGRLEAVSAWLLAKILHGSTQRFDKIISVSSVAKEFAKKTFGVDSVVAPNAIDLAKFSNNKNKKIYDVVFLGRLVTRKGCMNLLQAVNILVNKHGITDANVVIMGAGPELNRLKEYVSYNKLGSNVSFLGFVDEKKKRQILNSCKIAVFPASGGESFGIVLLEAMASGATVLAGDNPGYSSVLGSLSESLFNARNSKLLAEKINLFLTNAKLRSTLNNDQQKLVKSFDINVVGNAILKVYKS